MRYSMSKLFGLVAFAGIAIACLLNPSQSLERYLTTVTSLVLLTATACALYRPKSERPFWIGFALFGWFFQLRFDGGTEFVLKSLHTPLSALVPALAESKPDPKYPGQRIDLGFQFVATGKPLVVLLYATFGGIVATLLRRSPPELVGTHKTSRADSAK
jgi:hypothetical protein